MKQLSLTALAVLFALMMGSTAFAAGEKKDFSSLDTDGNGQLTEEEVAQDSELSDKWATVDENGDGVIDRAEFSAFEEAPAAGGMSEPSTGMSEPPKAE